MVNIRAGLPAPTSSTYTTHKRQLSCSFNEFQTPLDTMNYIVMSLSGKTSILDPIPTSEGRTVASHGQHCALISAQRLFSFHTQESCTSSKT